MSGYNRIKSEDTTKNERPRSMQDMPPQCSCGSHQKPKYQCQCCSIGCCKKCKKECKAAKSYSISGYKVKRGCKGTICKDCYKPDCKRCHKCDQMHKLTVAPLSQCSKTSDELINILRSLHRPVADLQDKDHHQLILELLKVCELQEQRQHLDKCFGIIKADERFVLLEDVQKEDEIRQMSRATLVKILRVYDNPRLSTKDASRETLEIRVKEMWRCLQSGLGVEDVSEKDIESMDEQKLKILARNSLARCQNNTKQLATMVKRMGHSTGTKLVMLQDLPNVESIAKLSKFALEDILRMQDELQHEPKSEKSYVIKRVKQLWRDYNSVKSAEELSEEEMNKLSELQLRVALDKNNRKRKCGERSDLLQQVKRLRLKEQSSIVLLRDISNVEQMNDISAANLEAIVREYDNGPTDRKQEFVTGSVADRVTHIWKLNQETPPADVLPHESLDKLETLQLKLALRKNMEKCQTRDDLIAQIKKVTVTSKPSPALGITSEQDLGKLSVRTIKKLLKEHSVDHDKCCEKKELVSKLTQLWKDLDRAGDVPERELCLICKTSGIDCVFLECGHMATCHECGQKVIDCPVCRMYVLRMVRIYRP